MKKTKIKLIIALIVLLCLLGIVVYISILIRRGEKGMDDEIIREANLQRVKNSVSYFTIAKCIEKYRNNLDSKNQTAIYRLLANSYKEEEKITEKNVFNQILPIDKEAIIKSMYESEQENEISYYVVYFSKGNEDAGGLIVVQDEMNQTFSIYPNEFMQKEGYNEIENVIEEDMENRLERIEENSHNPYMYIYKTEEEMIQEYIQNYIQKVNNDIEQAYSILEESCRQEKFPTIKTFEEYMRKNKEKWEKLEIQEYEIEYQEDCIEYIFSDTENNQYTIKEKYIMEYTVNL